MKKPIYLLVFSIILSAAALFCGVNIVIGIIYSASPNANDILMFYNNLANSILCVTGIINATVGLLLSVILLIKKQYKVPSVIILSACIISYIPILAAILI